MLRHCIESLDTPVLVEFCAQGTRFTLGFMPVEQYQIIGHPDAASSAHTFVGLFSYGDTGGFYPLMLGSLSVGYVMEKLHLRNVADATNLTALFNALGHPRGVEWYLANQAHLAPGKDYVNHDHMTEV